MVVLMPVMGTVSLVCWDHRCPVASITVIILAGLSGLWEAEIQVGQDGWSWLAQKVFLEGLYTYRWMAKATPGKPCICPFWLSCGYEDRRCVFHFLAHSFDFAGMGRHPVLENAHLFSVLPSPPLYLYD